MKKLTIEEFEKLKQEVYAELSFKGQKKFILLFEDINKGLDEMIKQLEVLKNHN